MSVRPGSCRFALSKADFFDLRRGAWIDALRKKTNSKQNKNKKVMITFGLISKHYLKEVLITFDLISASCVIGNRRGSGSSVS